MHLQVNKNTIFEGTISTVLGGFILQIFQPRREQIRTNCDEHSVTFVQRVTTWLSDYEETITSLLHHVF